MGQKVVRKLEGKLKTHRRGHHLAGFKATAAIARASYDANDGKGAAAVYEAAVESDRRPPED